MTATTVGKSGALDLSFPNAHVRRRMAGRAMDANTSTVSDVWARASCGFYAPASGARCRQPRSCYACLNAAIATEPQGCFVSSGGVCMSMDAFVPGKDAFASTNTTYCEAQDSACVRCRAIAANASRPSTPYCVGANACVCIVACEAPTWHDRVLPDCRLANASAVSSSPPLPTVPTAAVSYTSNTQQIVWYFALAQLPLLVIGLAIRARCRGSRKSPRKPARALELSGWRAMHEQLALRDRHRPPHAESVLNSALPPLAPSATDETTRPPLLTRTERNVWGAPNRPTPSSS